MQNITIHVGVLVALSIMDAFLLTILLVGFLRYQCIKPHRRESDEVSLAPRTAGSDFTPKPLSITLGCTPVIGIIGKQETIETFMHNRCQCEGQSRHTTWGDYEIRYNTSAQDQDVHAVVFLNEPGPEDFAAWKATGKPAAIEGTDAVRQGRWGRNWLQSLTDPFGGLLARMASENTVFTGSGTLVCTINT